MKENPHGTSMAEDYSLLRFCSIMEASTLVVLLCVAVPLKHVWGMPIAVKLMGPIHGLAFLSYMWAIFDATSAGGWRRSEVARLVIAAFIPFAGFFTAGFINRRVAQANKSLS